MYDLHEMSLDDIWDATLEQWKFIVEADLSDGLSVPLAKRAWVAKNFNIKDNVSLIEEADCLFCWWHANHSDPNKYYVYPLGNCKACPGQLVEEKWDCRYCSHSYKMRPHRFYPELKRLDKIRKAKNED